MDGSESSGLYGTSSPLYCLLLSIPEPASEEIEMTLSGVLAQLGDERFRFSCTAIEARCRDVVVRDWEGCYFGSSHGFARQVVSLRAAARGSQKGLVFKSD